MQIIFKDRFSSSLDMILDFIAQDSLDRAIRFNQQLNRHINTIPDMPYKYRKSFYHNNDNIRDMIFKGYTIPYMINEDNIAILDIFKWTDKQN
jgi:plasmid stabilization system protein ParE